MCFSVGGKQKAVRGWHPFMVGCVVKGHWWHKVGGPQVAMLMLLSHLV
jgi:hypothetical protein